MGFFNIKSNLCISIISRGFSWKDYFANASDSSTGDSDGVTRNSANAEVVQYTYIFYIISPYDDDSQNFSNAVDSIRTAELLFSQTGIVVPSFNFSELKSRIAPDKLVYNYVSLVDKGVEHLRGGVSLTFLYEKGLFRGCKEFYVDFTITLLPNMDRFSILQVISKYLTKTSDNLVFFRRF